MSQRSAHRGFTLIEMMVVAAIIVALLAVTMPTIRSIMRSGEMAQTENTVRAALTAARSYAVQKRIIAGVRFQDDGHIVQVYARNYLEYTTTNNPDNYRLKPVNNPILDMKAVEDRPPDMMSGPYRVTYGDVGAYSYGYLVTGYWMQMTWNGNRNYWPGTWECPGPNEWLDATHTWFALPVVLFDPNGQVSVATCQFRGDSNALYPGDPGPPGALAGSWAWYPTMTGSFIKATAQAGVTNSNPVAANHPFWPNPPGPPSYVCYYNQMAVAGWLCNGYKGPGSHWIPVESPSPTTRPRIFNYGEFRSVAGTAPIDLTNAACSAIMDNAVQVISTTANDLMIEAESGMVVRARNQDKTGNN